jgi:hypothetical protein
VNRLPDGIRQVSDLAQTVLSPEDSFLPKLKPRYHVCGESPGTGGFQVVVVCGKDISPAFVQLVSHRQQCRIFLLTSGAGKYRGRFLRGLCDDTRFGSASC